MASIQLVDGWRKPKPGVHDFLITKVVYDEEFDKVKVHFEDETGATTMEQFTLVKSDGKPNETALGIFSTMAKCALHDETNREIDFDDLEGLAVRAEAYERTYKSEKADKDVTVVNLKNWDIIPEEELKPDVAARLEEVGGAVEEAEEDEEDAWS